MQERNDTAWLVILACLGLLVSPPARTDSFRCGTKLVVTGDPVSRLVRNCGQPKLKYRAREALGGRGAGTTTSVTHWVYGRGRKKDMVVSVRSGRVVKITVE
jgi:hypothetical protein